MALFVCLMACFQRIGNMNLFPFRVKLSVFLSELPISWHYTLKVSCTFLRNRNKPTLNCLNSFHFLYRSQSSVCGHDQEEKWHSAAHPCVLPHLHTLHHRPALHNEASESARGVEKRWEAEALMGRARRCNTGPRQRKFCQLKLFSLMLHNLFDKCCHSNKQLFVLQ